MLRLLADPVVMQKFLIRLWHVALLFGSLYLASNPTSKLYWLTPGLVTLASASRSPFAGAAAAGKFSIPMDEITSGRLPCHPPGQPCEPLWGEPGCPFRRIESRRT